MELNVNIMKLDEIPKAKHHGIKLQPKQNLGSLITCNGQTGQKKYTRR